MATENRKSDSGVKGSDTPERELKTGKNPSTETASDGGRKSAGTGTGAGNSNSGTTSGKSSEKVSEVVSINPTETIPTPTEPKKAKKKRTVKKKTVKNDETFNAEQITALLLTVSTICSTSERGRIFALSEAEAKQLAEPLSKIIANNDSMKSLTEHSDSVALAITCFMIFAPKIFMWMQYEKAHRKPKGIEVKTIKGVKADAGKTTSHDRRNSSGTTPDSKNDGSDVLADLPSIM